MLSRRRILAGSAGLCAMGLAPGVALASGTTRPHLAVTVRDNHPLRMGLSDRVPYSIERVRSVVHRLGSWEKWVPLFTKSEVVKRAGSHRHLDAALDMPWPVRDRSFVADVTTTPYGYRMDYVPESGNMEDFSVTVQLTPIGTTHTFVHADMEVDFGLRLPKSVIEWLARRKVPEAFVALEERVEAS